MNFFRPKVSVRNPATTDDNSIPESKENCITYVISETRQQLSKYYRIVNRTETKTSLPQPN